MMAITEEQKKLVDDLPLEEKKQLIRYLKARIAQEEKRSKSNEESLNSKLGSLFNMADLVTISQVFGLSYPLKYPAQSASPPPGSLAEMAQNAHEAALASDDAVDTAAKSRDILNEEYADYLKHRMDADSNDNHNG